MSSAWQIRLMSVGASAQRPISDTLRFRKGQLVSEYLEGHGFEASAYSVEEKNDGTTVWKTNHTKPDGTRVSWYGVWNGKIMRGLLSEHPVQGTSRDLSFVSTKHVRKNKEVAYVTH